MIKEPMIQDITFKITPKEIKCLCGSLELGILVSLKQHEAVGDILGEDWRTWYDYLSLSYLMDTDKDGNILFYYKIQVLPKIKLIEAQEIIIKHLIGACNVALCPKCKANLNAYLQTVSMKKMRKVWTINPKTRVADKDKKKKKQSKKKIRI